MENKSLEELLFAYEVDVRFPDVSGVEHLDTLMIRSELEQHKPQMNESQLRRITIADEHLFQQRLAFFQAIDRIADMVSWRKQENAPPNYWWWYLDVLVSVPLLWGKTEVGVSAD